MKIQGDEIAPVARGTVKPSPSEPGQRAACRAVRPTAAAGTVAGVGLGVCILPGLSRGCRISAIVCRLSNHIFGSTLLL